MLSICSVISIFEILGILALLAGCSADVGSEAWCLQMKDKPNTDWTVNEAADFANHCVLKLSQSTRR